MRRLASIAPRWALPTSVVVGGAAAFAAWKWASPRALNPVSTPAVSSLASLDDLQRLGRSRSVVLVARGFPPADAASAVAAFREAAEALEASFPGQFVFFIVDDAANAATANALLTRLGLEHDAPFATILDRFIDTEEKYLMTQRASPCTSDLVSFVTKFTTGGLKPAMLGQPRPPRDRCASWPLLWEVVTDSFDEVVLDTEADVFLEALSHRCNACTAFAPRMRMLSAFAAVHAPRLRIATIDILDNDKPRACLPDKSTPSYWLYPAGSAGAAVSLGSGDKPACCSKQALRLPLSGGQHTASELPTLLDCLEFICGHTGGRVTLSDAARDEAVRLEGVAQELELALADVFAAMDAWKHFAEWAQMQPDADGAAASPIQLAAELRERVSAAFTFLRDEAAGDSLPEARRHLERISEAMAAADSMRLLQQAPSS